MKKIIASFLTFTFVLICFGQACSSNSANPWASPSNTSNASNISSSSFTSPSVSVLINSQTPIDPVGGKPPYSFKIVSGAGSLSGNIFTAPSLVGSTLISITDSSGASSFESISIYEGSLAIGTSTSSYPLFQCPLKAPGSLGGGNWGYYGCLGQTGTNSSCATIESPTSLASSCSGTGAAMSIYPSKADAASGLTSVQMFNCPVVSTLGGGNWGSYGCTGQITNNSTCTTIEYPTTQTSNCTSVGYSYLSPSQSSAKSIAQYLCPSTNSANGVTSGQWAFYGCTGQLTSNSSCIVIVWPSSQSYPCVLQGYLKVQ